MKRKKLNFDIMNTSLKRSELREITAGCGSSGGGSGGGSGRCNQGCSCHSGCQSALPGLSGFTGCSTTLRSVGCYVCHYSGVLDHARGNSLSSIILNKENIRFKVYYN